MRSHFKNNFWWISLLIGGLLYSSLSLAGDVSVQVGQNTVNIPVPIGFTELKTSMDPLYDIKQKLVAPTNREVVALISNSDATIANTGKIPTIQRSFSVQVARRLEGQVVTDIQFAALKAVIRDQNQQMMATAQERINQNLQNQTASINQKMNSNVHLSVTDTTVLPVHDDTPNSISYSMYVKANIGFGSAPDKDGVQKVSTVTVTFVHIHNQVLFFYVTGAQDDLNWTRDASKQWIAQALKDNP